MLCDGEDAATPSIPFAARAVGAPEGSLAAGHPAGSARVVLAEFSGDLLEEETSLIACSIYRRLWSVRCLFFWIIFVGCCLAGVSAKRS